MWYVNALLAIFDILSMNMVSVNNETNSCNTNTQVVAIAEYYVV